MSTTQPRDEAWWTSWFRYLPLILLALATAVALTTGPTTGATSPDWRLGSQLVLVAGTAVLIGWWTVTAPPSGEAGRVGQLVYVVRTAMTLALTLLNPLFCIFAWIGYLDVFDHFGRRAATVGIGVTAVTMALGQSGGVPWSGAAHAGLFAFLVLLNFGLAASLGLYGVQVERSNEARAATIGELQELNAALERVVADNAALQETVVAQARTAGVQEERQRLAREIHDTIAQSLAGILAQLQAAQDDPEPGTRVHRAAELARDALAEARRSVMDLAPAPLTAAGLPEALEGVIGAWTSDHPAQAELVVTGEVRPLHPEVEATVLRIAQEALSNVAKHAGATRVGVTLTYDDGEVVLDVRDDGAGFDAAVDAAPSSFGLRGMRQRAARLAGALDVEAETGSGTALSLRLPALERGAA